MSRPLLRSLFDDIDRRPLTVSQLTAQIRGALENRFASVWVEGEISNFKSADSGHWYFTIKDEGAQLRAKCFKTANCRIRFRPSNGLQVRARGQLSVWEPQGAYELIVEALDPVGAGALRVAFEQMRERLAAEGLFAEELKRPLPLFPRRVGVVTSASGAAIRDILNIISRRTRTVHVLFAPARVQGEGAGRDIARAVRLLNEHHRLALGQGRLDQTIDVIIVGRGGGSAEDLWAFNEEDVARAFRASRIPVISAVGHETDFTIADFAADVRAPTPSAAAEIVAACEDEVENRINKLTRDLVRAANFRVMEARNRVQDAAMSTGFDQVRARLRRASQRVEEANHKLEITINRAAQRSRQRLDTARRRLTPLRLSTRLSAARSRFAVVTKARDTAIASRLEDARSRFVVAVAELDALSPLAVLKRGYALAQDQDGHLLRDASSVEIGDAVSVRLAKGKLGCRVERSENS